MVWTILASLGSFVAVIAAIFIIGRGIFRQVDSTDRNTKAITDLTNTIEGIVSRLVVVEQKVAILMDRARRD